MVLKCLIELHYKLKWNQISILATYDSKHVKDILLVFLTGEVGLEIKEPNYKYWRRVEIFSSSII
jgi:hypothetical protein